MEEMTRMLAAVMSMTLESFDNAELAAFNNAVQLYGKVNPQNMAFDKAVKANIIKENGELYDVEATKSASAYEVNRRVDLGIFN